MIRRRWTRPLTCFWLGKVTGEAASCAWRDKGGFEMKSFLVWCTSCADLSTLDEAWCTGASRDDGRPNGRQWTYAQTCQAFPSDFWPCELRCGPMNLPILSDFFYQ